MKPNPNVTWAPPFIHRDGVEIPWTGPTEDDLHLDGVTLVRRVPWERWPFGAPNAHESCCNMFNEWRLSGGLYCDCCSSDESGEEFGEGA